METENLGVEELYLAPEETKDSDVVALSDASENELDATDPIKDTSDKPVKLKRIEEIPEQRGTNVKVFRMNDGSEQAVFSPSAIHVFDDETRTFEDVEDTIVEDEDGKHFTCGKNHFVAKFSREDDNDDIFSIEHGMHKVTVCARKNKKNKNKGVKPHLQKNNKDGIRATDLLTFADVEPETDYEYSVEGSGVKENIVVKKPAAIYRYPFLLKCENVTAQFDEKAKRIAFISNESGDEVFYIPSPFMSDDNGIVSTAVNYEMRTTENNEVYLTITADADWINSPERAFPVTIDPQIKLSGSSAMTTYSWSNGYLYSSSLHTVGTTGDGDGDCNAKRMYISLKMPTLPRNPRIKKAELVFTQNSGTIACEPYALFGLYHVDEDLSYGRFTPINDSDLIDFAKMKVDQTENGAVITYAFDVTSLVDQVSKNEIYTKHLVMKMLDESNACNNSITLYGSSYSSTDAPQFVITYESSYGVNTSYRTHTHELGRFGQGSVDLQCGNLMFESEDFAWSGNRMPVTIKHLFNSALAGYHYTQDSTINLRSADFSSMKLGNGFKLNIMQSMISAAFVHDGTHYDGYIYIGENGEETYFKKSETRVCCSSNSQCYNLYEDVNGGDMLYDPVKLTLKQGEDTYQFDAAGRLIRITDAAKNHMDITYTSNRITSVTDGAGREFGFGYNSNGQLTSITAPDGTYITYGYTSNLLTSVVYPDGKKAAITYSSNKPDSVTLQDANDETVYRVSYTFNGDRLTSITEYGADGAVGAKSTYSYSVASARTLVTTTEQMDDNQAETAENIITTTYTFDDDGNVVSEYSYSTDTGNITGIGQGSGINPHSDNSGVVSNINNLLVGHNFESLEAWSSMPENSDDFHIETFAQSKFGKNSLFMRSYNTEITENGIYQETDCLPTGQYTFSAYVNILSNFSGTNAGTFIRVTDTSGEVIATSEHLKDYDNEYTRLILPFELTTEQSVRVQILFNGRGGAFIDAAQLENNPYANAYNMLENGNFERGVDGWICETDGASCSADTCFNMSKSLALHGDINSKREVYQDAVVKTFKDIRETFTLSGWAKGYGLPNHARDNVDPPTFGLRAVITFADGSTQIETADFSPCTEEWQFASVRFAKDVYKSIDSIRVYCDYSYNSGTVYFDDIQLVRNSLETSLSSGDFDSGNNTDMSTPDYNNVETDSTSDSLPTFNEAKDKFGNALTETTFTDGEFGTIYRAFKFNDDDNCMAGDDAGNNLVEETDARGNKTTYTVDGDTSRNEEVTDRLGNKTAYEYDDSGRTTKVTSKDSEGDELAHVSYAYDTFDNMTEIVRGDGMKYALAYNEFHNLESIGIEGKDEKLIKYAYKNGNGRLKQMTYANGHTMKAVYNSIGQMVAEKWFETETEVADSTATPIAHYKYVYDGNGNIVRSIDILAKKEYNYEYEEGRIVRATEADIELNGEIVTSKVIVNIVKYYYNTEGKMTKKVITFADNSTHTVHYQNSDDNTVVKFSAGGRTVTSHSGTDSFGRKVFDELQLGTNFVSRQFVYHAGKITAEHKEKAKVKSSATTQLVSQIILSNGTTLSYGYDAEDRITSVVETYTVDDTPVTNTTLYTYDALGQLETETKDGVTTKFEYDNYGNITAKGVVDETGEIVEAAKISYVYGNDTWKDLLTSYNGQSITYDAQGNPLTYLGHTLEWEKGRQLKKFDNIEYTYNANGIRTSKTVGGVKHTYTLDGTKILRETWDGNTLIPLYDNEDGVCGILYNNVPYYFIKNLQGDVIAIVDKDAQTVARYSYDAWGAITNAVTYTELTNDVDIATINPFRYRSYYYDEEINLYYLQSRYYDACVGRFICSDEASIFNNTSNTASISINKFSYCLNNPINNADDCGNIASAIIKMISNFIFGMLGGMLGLYLANVTLNLANGKKDFYAKNDSWGTYIAEGVRSGAFSIFGSKYLIKLGAVLAASVIKQFVDMIIYKSSFSWKTLFWDLLIGGLVVTVIHFGPTVISKLPKKQKNNSSKWLSKVKDLIKKIAERIIATLQKKLEKLISFFKNTFVKRFSISYAKRIGSELKKIFS